MDGRNVFVGVSGAFWTLTFALMGFVLFVASVGGEHLVRLMLTLTATYSIIGATYGAWAARKAVARLRIGQHPTI
jgi:hypothetical protein